ncbi:hypothetical protein BDV19DRAFT_390611 [Aspergillus venezuelensis]
MLPTVTQSGSLISKITVAVNSTDSHARLQSEFCDPVSPVTFLLRQNLEAVQSADAVVLAFPPNNLHYALDATGMKQALQQKHVISLLARTPRHEIEDVLRIGETGLGVTTNLKLVRAMPTIGAAIHESATLLTDAQSSAAKETVELAAWMFGCLGRVFRITDECMDAATGVSALANALTTVAINHIVQIAVANGVAREDVVGVVAQCVRGTASMLLSDIEVGQLQDSLSSPGSITEQAISQLERGLPKVLEVAASVAIARATNYEKRR